MRNWLLVPYSCCARCGFLWRAHGVPRGRLLFESPMRQRKDRRAAKDIFKLTLAGAGDELPVVVLVEVLGPATRAAHESPAGAVIGRRPARVLHRLLQETSTQRRSEEAAGLMQVIRSRLRWQYRLLPCSVEMLNALTCSWRGERSHGFPRRESRMLSSQLSQGATVISSIRNRLSM